MYQWMYKKRNEGSSLMFVIIAVAFVGILATILLRVTLINMDVKNSDRQAKRSFYQAEDVMNQVNIAVQNIAINEMETVYVGILKDYATTALNTTDEKALQTEFARQYLQGLVKKLSGSDLAVDKTDSSGTSYKLLDEYYRPSVIKSEYNEVLKATVDSGKVNEYLNMFPLAEGQKNKMTLKFSTAYNSEWSLTLHDVHVEYQNKDTKDTSEITTDFVLTVPKLSFESSNVYPEFTKYSIIGDDSVNSNLNSKGIQLNGCLYAGHEGINLNKGEVKIYGSGANVITRGDITVEQGASLDLGDKDNVITVWAENMKTKRASNESSSEAKLNVFAESYVHDDLSLDAPYSNVEFRAGKYIGYTFNKDNVIDPRVKELDSQYSSAILINGKQSSLFMGDQMQSLLLGGRAFVSRSSENEKYRVQGSKDIEMGQATSVKSDQNFMKVDEADMVDGFQNPMSYSEYNKLIKEKGTTINSKGTVYRTPLKTAVFKELRPYLNATAPVTTYVYSLSQEGEDAGTALVYLYYNFKNDAQADAFFRDYQVGRLSEMAAKMKSSEYLKFNADKSGGLDILSGDLAVVAASNVVSYSEKDGVNYNPGITNEADLKPLLSDAIYNASQYKSLQLTLTNGDWSTWNGMADSWGNAGFDLLRGTRTTSSGANEIYKDEQQVVDTVLLSKKFKGSEIDKYTFVKESEETSSDSSHENAFGYRVMEKASTVKYKAVKVNITSTIGNESPQYAYAIFVSQAENSDSINTGDLLADVKKNYEKKWGKEEGEAYKGFNAFEDTILIVANKDVNVTSNLHGIIISDGKVNLGASNITLEAQPLLVQAMFSAQKRREGNVGDNERFLHYFTCFDGLDFGEEGSVDESIVISNYVAYSNWKKNED